MGSPRTRLSEWTIAATACGSFGDCAMPSQALRETALREMQNLVMPAGPSGGPFTYRGAGTVRRRTRRRVRPRVFSNARTATRNRDLPLAIRRPHNLLPSAPGNTSLANSDQCSAATTAGFFITGGLRPASCYPDCEISIHPLMSSQRLVWPDTLTVSCSLGGIHATAGVHCRAQPFRSRLAA
jgi:hypothetical protein